MRKAKVRFLFTKTFFGVNSKIIEIKYNNFQDLTSKIKSYIDNGLIITRPYDKNIDVYKINHLLSDTTKEIAIGFYVSSDLIKSNIIEFINNKTD